MSITAGISFKTEHLDDALTARASGLWFEIHAGSYLVDGGARRAALDALAEQYPISIHGAGLALASTERPNPDRLVGLRALSERVMAIAISDHLDWRPWDGIEHSDTLPFPRDRHALATVVENVMRVQDTIRRPIMLENPASYVDVPGHDFDEPEFLVEICRRTGCGLVIDITNCFVSASNLAFSPERRLDAIPSKLIGEIHLGGHSADPDVSSHLLVNSQDGLVGNKVWSLYRRLIDRVGPRPTLIERRGTGPSFAALLDERRLAHDLLDEAETVRA